MNIGVIGPGDIGEVIVRKLRDADSVLPRILDAVR
jgi:predicted dinucleotide-utilizing enzyme